MNKLIPAALIVLAAIQVPSASADAPLGWRQDGSGRFPKATPPLEWSKDRNVAWKSKLPGPGFGSPVVCGERIFVVSHPAELLCVRADDGKVLWQRSNTAAEVYGKEKAAAIGKQFDELDRKRNEAVGEFHKLVKELKDKGINSDKKDELDQETRERLDRARRKIAESDTAARKLEKILPRKERGGEPGNAAATPACDGKHVAAVFGTGIVAVYTPAGERLWIRFLQTPAIGFGHSASPVLAGGKLIVHLNDLLALDPATGKELWRVALPARHASPVVTRLGEEEVLIPPAGPVIRVRDGKVLTKGKFSLSESTVVLDGATIYASNSGQVQAVRLAQGEGDGAALEELWRAAAAGDRRTPSSLLHDGLLYAVNTSGILDVIDVKTGKPVYRKRLPLGSVYTSVTLAGGYLFIQDTRGKTLVLRPGRRYEAVAVNQLEGTGACPVFVGRRMYLRGQQHLYCIEAKDES
jgi:outer membrane protein assembly factor BamB